MKYLSYEEFEKANVFGKGAFNEAFAQYFIGNSYLNPLTVPGRSPIFLANVTFEPGCRNNWHIHHAKKDTWFSHIAFDAPGEDPFNEWCEAVTDEEYSRLDEK